MPNFISIDKVRNHVDFAIITIREDEFEAVLERFSPRQPVHGGKQLYEYCRFTTQAGSECGVAVVRLLEQGQTVAQSVARDVIDDLDPGWLILTGIAGGVPDPEFSLGDVLLASRLHDFSVSAALEGGWPEYQQTGGPMHSDVERLLSALPAWRERLGNWNSEASIGRAKPAVSVPKGLNSHLLYGSPDFKKKVRDSLARHFPDDGPIRPPLFHIGPSATANVLVKDPELLRQWRESARHLTHVEMEAGGVYQASRHGGRQNYPLLCVRGLSDIVGFRRSPEWTDYACHAAAAFVHALLQSGAVQVGSGRQTGPTEGQDQRDEAKHREDVAPQISPTRLRHGAECLLGREEELKRLNAAWDDPRTHVVSIVAWGGVGKTSLVVEWMARLAADGWRGAERVFDWSFYSQGTHEQGAASAEAFVRETLRFFGDPEMAESSASAWDKGARLARLVAERRTLLVLDGLEPLQHPPGPLAGHLKDQAMEALLKGLVLHNPGLCLLTTRESVADLAPFHGTTAPEWELKHLATPDGVKLLKVLGVLGIKAEFWQLVEDVAGHALTLNLLGGYLARAHGGDIRRRDQVKFEKADAEVQGGHAFKTMAAYEKWLAEGGEGGARQLAALRLLGLFDRPADAGCLAALRREPAIPGLTEPLVGLCEDDWNLTLSSLADCGLVFYHKPTDSPTLDFEPWTLDSHPLVREYFAKQLREKNPEAWRSAHHRLYEHFKDSAEYQPDTLEGLQPLYQAIAHGCRGGQYEDALHEVFQKRILRGDLYSRARRIVATGEDLAAVSCFFEEPWKRLASELTIQDKATLYSWAGLRLRAVGRFKEALEAFHAGLDFYVQESRWADAADTAGHIASFLLVLGNIKGADEWATQAVDFANRSECLSQIVSRKATLANVRHTQGNIRKAIDLFKEANDLLQQTNLCLLDFEPIQYFRFCDLLLSRGLYDEARSCASDMLSAVRSKGWIVEIAVGKLLLGRIAWLFPQGRQTVGFAEPEKLLNEAVDSFRNYGYLEWICRSLLVRGTFHCANGQFQLARQDLGEAEEIADREGMGLWVADCHLEAARLCLAEFKACQFGKQLCEARQHLDKVKMMLDEMGYGRRWPELELAAARLGLLEGRSDEASVHIKVARSWILPLDQGGKGFVCHSNELNGLVKELEDLKK